MLYGRDYSETVRFKEKHYLMRYIDKKAVKHFSVTMKRPSSLFFGNLARQREESGEVWLSCSVNPTCTARTSRACDLYYSLFYFGLPVRPGGLFFRFILAFKSSIG